MEFLINQHWVAIVPDTTGGRTMLSFGQSVKRERLVRGWTLEFVARRLRTHKGYVSGIETGRVNPPAANLTARFAKLDSLPPTELMILSHLEKTPKVVRRELFKRVYGKHVADAAKPPLPRREAAYARKLIKDGQKLGREYRALLKELRALI
jgi:transcriptional regulator with XRE-family HTH domain